MLWLAGYTAAQSIRPEYGLLLRPDAPQAVAQYSKRKPGDDKTENAVVNIGSSSELDKHGSGEARVLVEGCI